MSLKCKFSDPNRGKQTALTRLRFGKCLLNDTLHIFQKHPSGLCDFCYYPENVHHYLLECIEFIEFQDEIRMFDEEDNLIPVSVLLSNKCNYDFVWEYINKTKKKIIVL